MPAARDVAGRRYALAIMEIASQNGTIDRWSEVVDALEALTAQTAYVEALQADGLADDRFRAIIEQVVPGVAPVELNLFRLLRRKNRLQLGGSIASYYRELRDEARNIVHATVTTAQPLEPERETAIREALQVRTGGEVALETNVDEALLGGVVVRIGDTMIDGSVRSRLRRLRQELREGGSTVRRDAS